MTKSQTPAGASSKRVAAFVPNLMDRSRFDGSKVAFVSSATAVGETAAELVIVDIDRCDDPAPFRLDGVTVIGFGSHVDVESANTAREAGYDEVLARSVFFRRLGKIVDGF